jgi:hypothetical protein
MPADLVVYTNTGKRCPGTVRVHQLLHKSPRASQVLVQDIPDLRAERQPLPSFLKGTPTLYVVATQELYEGSGAVEMLQAFLHRELPSPRTTHLPTNVLDLSGDNTPNAGADPRAIQPNMENAPLATDELVAWGEEEPASTDQAFCMEAGCDPASMSSSKVSTDEVERVMRARGLDGQGSAPPEGA